MILVDEAELETEGAVLLHDASALALFWGRSLALARPGQSSKTPSMPAYFISRS